MNETLLPGFGTLLKAAREARQLTSADVSAKLKLTPRQIEAIEAEDLENLPQGVYLRGFVRNYARLVEVDIATLIAPVDAEAAVTATVTAKNEGVRLVSRGVRRWLVVPLVVMALFVVLVALLYEWLRHGQDAVMNQVEKWHPAQAVQALPSALHALPVAQPSAAVVVTPTTSAVVAPAPLLASSALPAAPASVAPAPSLQVTPAPVAAPVHTATQVPAPIVLASTQPSVPKAAELADVRVAGGHSLRFEVGKAAWVSIVDAKGQRYSKLVPTGGREVFKGEPPFRLVVGEAAQVHLSYDGHLIDLTPYIGQKVARLTLE